MNNILTIHSYKGGTGKSLISLNIGHILSQNNRVLIIETDFLMPCYFHIFPELKANYYYNDFYSGNDIPLRNCIVSYSKKRNFDLVLSSPYFDSEDRIFTTDQKWHLNRLRALSKELKDLTPRYDYIIFDTPPGRNFIAINNLVISHLVITVLRPSNYSLIGTKQMFTSVYNKTRPDKLLPCFVVFNQVPEPQREEMKEKLDLWVNSIKSIKNLEKYFIIPLLLNTALRIALGEMIFENGSFHELMKKISSEIEILFKK